MKGKNKPDNLEDFFKPLGEYEEDPGADFWDRIAPIIPQKPMASTFVYKGWMIAMAFLGGLLFSSLFFYWQSNTQLLNNLETQIIENNNLIEVLQQKVLLLQNFKETNITLSENKTLEIITANKEITRLKSILNSKAIGSPEKAKLNASIQTNKEPLIKLEIARKTDVVATVPSLDGSWLQPRFLSITQDLSRLFAAYNSNQLLSNNAFEETRTDSRPDEVGIETVKTLRNLSLLPVKKVLAIPFDEDNFDLNLAEKLALFRKSQLTPALDEDYEKLTSFITGSINPLSSYKYNLAGFQPTGPVALESAGIGKSWNWSVYGGFETKSKWSVQMGIDYNKLSVVKESVNNVRFKEEDAQLVNGGYVYSFNQRTDGALGQVSVSSTVSNQFKNDGKDILDGDLFQLSISTEQPVKIIRLPILGGYRFDLSSRFYVTPKLGVSAVWKIKDQTQLREIKPFSDRLSVQKSDIFLTTKRTTESLEANFRTEFGFRWRKRWYLVAEPRYKYGKSLFQYKDLELKDSPFHLMVGIRFNVD
ncbi:MAG: hypothetical protein AB8G86_29845 [Saprospiraceae bacterium]